MTTSSIALAELAEKGADVDVLHGVLCAAGFNIRWLLRAIARRGLAAVFFALYGLVLCVLRSCLATSDRRVDAQCPLTRTAHSSIALST